MFQKLQIQLLDVHLHLLMGSEGLVSGGVVAPVSRRWGNHSILVKSVSAQWALLSPNTYPKISSFQPELPGFDPRIFGTESERTSDELPSTSGLRTVKMQPE